MWRLGVHRLVCGDSRDTEVRARALGDHRAETLVYDPPFEDAGLIDALPLTAFPDARDVLVFGSCAHATARRVQPLVRWRFGFVWDGVQRHHDRGRPLLAHKTCDWFSGSGQYEDAVTDPRDGARLTSIYRESITHHSAGEHAKPVGWLAMLLGNCTRGAILSLFAGTGADLLAAHALGRPWCGVEIDPTRCAAAIARWENRTMLTAEKIA